MKQKVIAFIRSCKSEEILGHLALIVLQEWIKVLLKDKPQDRAHLMDGNADNYHELDNIVLPSGAYGDNKQFIVEFAKKLLRYGS